MTSTTGLIILAVIFAVLHVMALISFRPRRAADAAKLAAKTIAAAPATKASATTPATKIGAVASATRRQARAPDDVGHGSCGRDDATVPLLAIYIHDATTLAGYALPSSCGHSTAASGHSDFGGYCDSGSCRGH